MPLKDIIFSSGGALLIILTLVQISPLKIDPWSWIAKTIGKALNKDVSDKLEALTKQVSDLETKVKGVDKKVGTIDTKVDDLETKVNDVDTKIKDVDTKVDTIDTKVAESEKHSEERDIVLCRARMLRFGDEILHGQRHSKDHFDQILLDCTAYMNYCNAHPGFINNITEHTIDLINNTYDKCLEDKSFL